MTAILGKRRSASPPEGGEPPAKKVALGSPAGSFSEPSSDSSSGYPPGPPPGGPPRRKWEFKKIDDIPQSIRAKNVAKFSVEVLYKGENDQEEPVNHTIARLTFQHKQEHDTAYMVAGTAGLLIDLQVDVTMVGKTLGVLGDLTIKTFTYDGIHSRAVYGYDVPLKVARRGRGGRKQGKTVKDFLEVISGNNLVPCGFNHDTHMVGCKDFVSQYVYRLNEAKVLDIPADAAHDYYDRFNYNHTLPYQDERDENDDDYSAYKTNVGRAIWNPIYYENHVDIPGIVYEGRRLFWDPVTRVPGGADVETSDFAYGSSAGSSGLL